MIDDDNIHNDDFNLTADFGLSTKERAIADLYRGGSAEFIGNKKRCYMVFHPRSSERTAEKRASELFKKEAVQRYLAIKTEDLSKKVDIDAQRLIEDSERLKKLCFGDESYTELVYVDDEPIEREFRGFNPSGVKSAIELQGKLIGAFSETTVHSVDEDTSLSVEFVKAAKSES